jgi:glutamate racemase
MIASESPIGLFDSGVGGLTVAAAIRNILPSERMIYFGDTAHLPYGDKSKENIIQYSLGISDFLLGKGCKLILVACNSASSNAFDEIKKHIGDRALLMNVIDPVIDFVVKEYTIKHVGVIGTKATVNSKTYPSRIKGLKPSLQVSSMATPLFVPMIEEGFIFDDISNAIIRSYLSKPELDGIDSLILACTHYPIIMNQISRFFNFNVDVLDSAKIVAEHLKKVLREANLLNAESDQEHKFYVSDHTDYFGIIAKMFFGDRIDLEKIDIWR